MPCGPRPHTQIRATWSSGRSCEVGRKPLQAALLPGVQWCAHPTSSEGSLKRNLQPASTMKEEVQSSSYISVETVPVSSQLSTNADSDEMFYFQVEINLMANVKMTFRLSEKWHLI